MAIDQVRCGAYLVNLGKQLNFRTVKDTESQRHHLEILGAGSGGDIARFGANVIDDGLLEPWDEEVCAFIDDLVAESTVSIVVPVHEHTISQASMFQP